MNDSTSPAVANGIEIDEHPPSAGGVGETAAEHEPDRGRCGGGEREDRDGRRAVAADVVEVAVLEVRRRSDEQVGEERDRGDDREPLPVDVRLADVVGLDDVFEPRRLGEAARSR